MSARSIAEEISPILRKLADSHKNIFLNSLGSVERKAAQFAWPTFLEEIPNGIEILIQTISWEFSSVRLGELGQKIQDIEENPKSFAQHISFKGRRIVAEHKKRIIADSGNMLRRSFTWLAWNPVMDWVFPTGVEHALHTLIEKFKSLSDLEFLNQMQSVKNESSHLKEFFS